MSYTFLFSKERNTKELISSEIERLVQITGSREFDRDTIRQLLLRLHNDVVPDETTLDLFFRQGETKVSSDLVQQIVFEKVPIPDVQIKSSSIFPKEQTEIQGFVKPNLSTVRYDDTNVAQIKDGQLRKAYRSLLGKAVHMRYCIVDQTCLQMFDKNTRDTPKKVIMLSEIHSITESEPDKNGYPFTLLTDEKEVTLYCVDDVTRADWMSCIASLALLDMVANESNYSSERLQNLVAAGANKDCSYSDRRNPIPILLYLVMNNHMEDAKWLIMQKAHTECLLRWQFVAESQSITTGALYQLLIETGSSLRITGDDGLKLNILHYICYFGDTATFNTMKNNNYPDFAALGHDFTYNNDTALSISLVSPLTSDDVKIHFASVLININFSFCNKSLQNPFQLILLKGKIGLLFQILPLSLNTPDDSYGNSILHLAIKAHLPTVARYLIRFIPMMNCNSIDCDNDTVFSLAVKADEEELACEILKNCNPDVTHKPKSWIMPNSENDSLFHQVLKRKMQTLGCQLCDYGDFFNRDTRGNCLLHIALNNKLDRVIEALVNTSQAPTYINEPNAYDQDTPLHLALKLGYYEHSRLLIEKNSNVNACNKNCLTPVHILTLVAMNEFQAQAKFKMTPEQISDLLNLMLSKQPDLEIASNKTSTGGNETCLHIAIRGGEMTESLATSMLEYDKKLVDTRDNNGNTPLSLAVIYQNTRLVRILCDAGSSLIPKNNAENTPLHIAVENGNVEIVREIVHRGSYNRIWNRDGLCPIHLAIQKKNLSIVKLLCRSEIDANLRTRDGYTPYMLSCLNGAFDCGSFVISRGGDPYLLTNTNQSCLSLLANSVRQAFKPLDFAFSSMKMLNFVDEYRNDIFGDIHAIDNDIQKLDEIANDAQNQGYVLPEVDLEVSDEEYMEVGPMEEPGMDSIVLPGGGYPEVIPSTPSNPIETTPEPMPMTDPISTEVQIQPMDMEARRTELFVMHENLLSQLNDKKQELDNLYQEEQNRLDSYRESVVDHVKTGIHGEWQSKYQEVIDLFIKNGRSMDEAQKEAFNFFVNITLKRAEEEVTKEMEEMKEAVGKSIEDIQNQLFDVEAEINKLPK